jgi:hypothetical protein
MLLGRAARFFANVTVAMTLLALGACGGGGGAGAPSAGGPDACSLPAQKDWLRSYMQEQYLWTGSSPDPEPTGFDLLQNYFSALLSKGVGAVPADRWSYITESASYNRYFEEGKTLGYGVAVNGLEQQLPLKLRYVEPQSSAAAQGLARGDVILSINGRPSAELLASLEFGALSASTTGEQVTLQIVGAAGLREVTLTSAFYPLTPVPVWRVLSVAGDGKVGYLLLKDFVTQAETALVDAFDAFRAAGANELILDLRYNGGGLISVANVLASLVAGSAHDGKVFTRLSFNAKQSASNTSYKFAAAATGFARVLVLTGSRTCSASELIVNGLRPYVEVVMLGGQTCGKPVGFVPAEACGSTVSAVNFETLNAHGEGGYYDGIAPQCAVTEDFDKPFGDPTETLTAAALRYLQSGRCAAPAVTPSGAAKAAALWRRARSAPAEPGEWRGMRAD